MISKNKFFLASAGELKRERDIAELLIHRRNSHMVDRNMFFEVIRWEELPLTFEKGSYQTRPSSCVGECDALIALFHTKVGKFTKEELDIAFHNFKLGLNPRYILVFFKNTKRSISKIDKGVQDILKLRKKISNNKQIFIEFRNSEEFELLFLKQLEMLAGAFEREIGLIIPSESIIASAASKIPTDIACINYIPNEQEVRQLAESIGLFKNWRVNPHLTFEGGDINFFCERHRSRPWLEAQFRARYLILQRAEELELFIPEPGDLSEKAKPVEARLLASWQSIMAKMKTLSKSS